MSELLAISLPLKGDVLCAGIPGPVSVAGEKQCYHLVYMNFLQFILTLRVMPDCFPWKLKIYLIIEAYSYKGKRQGKVLIPLIQGPSFTEPDFRALKDAHFGCFV